MQMGVYLSHEPDRPVTMVSYWRARLTLQTDRPPKRTNNKTLAASSQFGRHRIVVYN